MLRQTVRYLVLALLLQHSLRPGEIQAVVSQVSQPNYSHHLRNRLQARSGDNRGPQGAQHDQTRDAIHETFQRLGLTTTLHAFQYQGETYYNVSGVLRGKTRPDEYYVVGAHFDSKNNPGADDNASGVAGILEAARVASLHDFGASLVFLAFDQEEKGLVGSKAWVQDHATDLIRGMVSLDMISFNPPGPNQNLVAVCVPDTAYNSTLAAFQTAVAAYSRGLTPVYGGVSGGSDHASFARLAPSVLAIEASFKSNTNYHKATDSIDSPNFVDYAYATEVTRSTVGYLAMQADLLPEPASTMHFHAGAITNAASSVAGFAAPSQITTLYGSGFPEGSRVTVRDKKGVEFAAAPTYFSARQINLVLPDKLALGPATVTISRPDGGTLSAGIQVQSSAPGIFTADMSGTGAAAAQAVLARPDATQRFQTLFSCTADTAGCAALPLDFGADDDRAVLVLYGTGIRGSVDLDSVRLEIAGLKLPVQYAGAHSLYPGLDQVNVELPRSLQGRGTVEAILRVDGIAANPVHIRLGP